MSAKQLKLRPDNPCPCGSAKLLRDCCLSPSGHLRVTTRSIRPRPPVTGHAQEGCYLATTMDCSADLSAEHYISKSVLETLGDVVEVSGTPWLPHGGRRQIGINSLTAKILCSRHNSALSPLDSAAGIFVKAAQRCFQDLQRRYLSRAHRLVLVSGEALEQWMLKAACGLFYSKNAAHDGVRLIDEFSLDQRLMLDALLGGKWAPKCGLFVRAPLGHSVAVANNLAIAPLTATGASRVVGAMTTVWGIEFHLVLDPYGINFDGMEKDGWRWRPSELLFENATLTRSIGLTWAPGTPACSIRMENS